MPTISLEEDPHLQNFKFEFLVTCASGTGEAQCNFHATGHLKSARKRVLLARKNRCRHTSAARFNKFDIIWSYLYIYIHLFTLYWDVLGLIWTLMDIAWHVNQASRYMWILNAPEISARQIVSPFASPRCRHCFAGLQANRIIVLRFIWKDSQVWTFLFGFFWHRSSSPFGNLGRIKV